MVAEADKINGGEHASDRLDRTATRAVLDVQDGTDVAERDRMECP